MPENVEALRPKLEQAKNALEAALEEACETDVSTAQPAELLRLEESLSFAREAARTTIELIHRLHGDEPSPDEPRSGSPRLFVDDRGVQWEAFCVYPTRSATLPAPYHQGWLTMQCQDEIRRVAPIPDGWRDLSRPALCELVSKAVAAPRRARSKELEPDEPEEIA